MKCTKVFNLAVVSAIIDTLYSVIYKPDKVQKCMVKINY